MEAGGDLVVSGGVQGDNQAVIRAQRSWWRMRHSKSAQGWPPRETSVRHSARDPTVPALDIPANVDFSTGDINFLGDVCIHGDICSGFTVRAIGNITVGGVVEACTVEARAALRPGPHGAGADRLGGPQRAADDSHAAGAHLRLAVAVYMGAEKRPNCRREI